MLIHRPARIKYDSMGNHVREWTCRSWWRFSFSHWPNCSRSYGWENNRASFAMYWGCYMLVYLKRED